MAEGLAAVVLDVMGATVVVGAVMTGGKVVVVGKGMVVDPGMLLLMVNRAE